MENKLSPAQFRFINNELAGDCSVTDNISCKEMDERMHTIMKTEDPNILRDLQINNSLKAKSDNFWDVTRKKLKNYEH